MSPPRTVQTQRRHTLSVLSASVKKSASSSSWICRHSSSALLTAMLIKMILYYLIVVAAASVVADGSVPVAVSAADAKNNNNDHDDIGQQSQQAHRLHFIVDNKHLRPKTMTTTTTPMTLPSKSHSWSTTTSRFRPIHLLLSLPPNLHHRESPPPHQPISFGTTTTTTTGTRQYHPLAPNPPNPRHSEYFHGLQQQDRALANNNIDNDCLSLVGNILHSGAQGYVDLFGEHVSISQNGQFVAVGGRFYNGVAGVNTGLVQVHENTNVTNNNNNGQQWIQRGNNIEGENAGDWLFANALSNDGKFLAVGVYFNDDNGSKSGHVRVYQFNIVLGDWQQLGDTLVGLAPDDYFGWSVALSGDGTILAVGALFGGGPNDEGQVRVFFWNGSTTWVNQGDPINGQNFEDEFGWSIALSENGSILAVGAYANDANGKSNSGSIQVFEFTNNNNSWNPLGQELYGDNADDWFGFSVSLSSNGQTLAVGARLADSNGVSNSGQVQVYHFNENEQQWTQHGSSLIGNAVNDYFGGSVSLSGNGLILAVGAPQSSGRKGFLRMFQWNVGAEDWQPFGKDLAGTTADDELGDAVAVARDGSTVVVGGDASGTGRPGLAMVVQLEASCQTMDPRVGPTMSPAMPLTTSPTTKNPTMHPTISPTVRPTASPVASPTASPTVRPTVSPTPSPTPSPAMSPTASPTRSPTMSSMVGSTVSPSVGSMTLKPTTVSPTVAPTIAPRGSTPSFHPTTMSPVVSPTEVPRAPVLQESTGKEVVATITGITMDFVGVEELTERDMLDFGAVTEDWYEAYYDSLESSSPNSVQVRDLETSISVKDQDVNTVEGINTIQYDQTLVYVALDDTSSARDHVLRPFLDAGAKTDYAAQLQTIEAFQNVGTPIPNPSIPVDPKKVYPQGLPLGVLVGAIVGSLAFVVACLVVALLFQGYRKRHQQEGNSYSSNDNFGNQEDNSSNDSEDISHGHNHQQPITMTPVAVPQPNAAPRLPTFKDQAQNVVPEAQQDIPVPFAAAKLLPTHSTT